MGVPMVDKLQWQNGYFKHLEYIQLDEVNHIFTHKKWIITPIAIKWSNKLESYLENAGVSVQAINYFYENELKEIPIATAFKKVLKSVQIKLK